MRLGNPKPGDVVFRHVVYPLAHAGKRRDFSSPKYMRFKNMGGVYRTSLAWRRFLPTIDAVHEYGCNISSGINASKLVNGVLPAKSRHVYAGAYALDPGA